LKLLWPLFFFFFVVFFGCFFKKAAPREEEARKFVCLEFFEEEEEGRTKRKKFKNTQTGKVSRLFSPFRPFLLQKNTHRERNTHSTHRKTKFLFAQ
jgi:hypothetical protein